MARHARERAARERAARPTALTFLSGKQPWPLQKPTPRDRVRAIASTAATAIAGSSPRVRVRLRAFVRRATAPADSLRRASCQAITVFFELEEPVETVLPPDAFKLGCDVEARAKSP
eukprot:3183275-Prymnesium_polylepis.2